MTKWTGAMRDRLRELHATDAPFTEISRTLSSEFDVFLTRNACIGKAHRMSLPPRPTPSGVQFRPAKSYKPKPKPVATKPPELVVVEPPKPKPIKEGQVSLFDLGYGMCRWPHGERPPYLFCGKATESGSSWCAHHRGIVHPLLRRTG